MFYSRTHSLLRFLPPEEANRLALLGLKVFPLIAFGIAQGNKQHLKDSCFSQHILGMDFAHPVGLAAGFDKNAFAVKGVFGHGFAFAEFGTITPDPQSGNIGKRVFRLPQDQAVINRFGFNNDGMHVVKKRLALYRKINRKGQKGIIGINIGGHAYHSNGKRIDDYAEVAYALAEYADYITINLSSPNTHGLRALQKPATIGKTIEAVRSACADKHLTPPILVKLAPDFADKDFKATLDSLGACKVDGIIFTNTTTTRPSGLRSPDRNKKGGLSGKPLMRMSTERLAVAHQHFATSPAKTKPILIGVGGVDSVETAYAKILAGANLVQLYTALIFKGPALVQEIVTGLDARLKADGVNHISDIIGQAQTAEEAMRMAGVDASRNTLAKKLPPSPISSRLSLPHPASD